MTSDDNPRGTQAVTITSVFTCAAFIVVVLRLYTRLRLVRYHGVEDYGVILAMVESQRNKVQQRPSLTIH